MRATIELIENWRVLRMVAVSGILLGFVAIALVTGWVANAARRRTPPTPRPRISPEPWQHGTSLDDRRAA